jgi:hypothetical protein
MATPHTDLTVRMGGAALVAAVFGVSLLMAGRKGVPSV